MSLGQPLRSKTAEAVVAITDDNPARAVPRAVV